MEGRRRCPERPTVHHQTRVEKYDAPSGARSDEAVEAPVRTQRPWDDNVRQQEVGQRMWWRKAVSGVYPVAHVSGLPGDNITRHVYAFTRYAGHIASHGHHQSDGHRGEATLAM